MKIFVVGEQEKCGGCSRHADKLYFMAESQEQANDMYDQAGGRGLCAVCLISLLQDEGYEILEGGLSDD